MFHRIHLAALLLPLLSSPASPQGIEVKGNAELNSWLEVTVHGEPFDTYALYIGLIPLPVPMLSGNTLGLLGIPGQVGVLDWNGEAKYWCWVPDLDAFAGSLVGYAQAEISRFNWSSFSFEYEVTPGAFFLAAPKGAYREMGMGIRNARMELNQSITIDCTGPPAANCWIWSGPLTIPTEIPGGGPLLGIGPIAVPINFPTGFFDSSGHYAHTADIPPIPEIVGYNLFFQATVFDLWSFQFTDVSPGVFITIQS